LPGTPHGNRVLVVDDSAITVRMMTQLLTRAGFVCASAANGQEALDVWKREVEAGQSFDVTLIDKVCACCCASRVYLN
jgi:CheY-like chemotaxis protein